MGNRLLIKQPFEFQKKNSFSVKKNIKFFYMIAQCDIEEDISKEAVVGCVGRKIQMECQSKNVTARSIVVILSGVVMGRTC